MKYLIFFVIFFSSFSAQALPINIVCEKFKGYTYYFTDKENDDKEFEDDESKGLKLSLYIDDNNYALLSYISELNKAPRNNEIDGDKLQISVSHTIPGKMRIQVLEFPGADSINRAPGNSLFYIFNINEDKTAEVIKTTYRMNTTLPKATIEKGECKVHALSAPLTPQKPLNIAPSKTAPDVSSSPNSKTGSKSLYDPFVNNLPDQKNDPLKKTSPLPEAAVTEVPASNATIIPTLPSAQQLDLK